MKSQEREKYIQDGLNGQKRTSLTHLMGVWGIPSRGMSKEEMVRELTSALLQWASKEDMGLG